MLLHHARKPLLHPGNDFVMCCTEVIPQERQHRLAITDIAVCSMVVKLSSRHTVFPEAVEQILVAHGVTETVTWDDLLFAADVRRSKQAGFFNRDPVAGLHGFAGEDE